MTPVGNYRLMILRFYWDGEREPSVEVPVGDFFAADLGELVERAQDLRRAVRELQPLEESGQHAPIVELDREIIEARTAFYVHFPDLYSALAAVVQRMAAELDLEIAANVTEQKTI